MLADDPATRDRSGGAWSAPASHTNSPCRKVGSPPHGHELSTTRSQLPVSASSRLQIRHPRSCRKLRQAPAGKPEALAREGSAPPQALHAYQFVRVERHRTPLSISEKRFRRESFRGVEALVASILDTWSRTTSTRRRASGPRVFRRFSPRSVALARLSAVFHPSESYH